MLDTLKLCWMIFGNPQNWRKTIATNLGGNLMESIRWAECIPPSPAERRFFFHWNWNWSLIVSLWLSWPGRTRSTYKPSLVEKTTMQMRTRQAPNVQCAHSFVHKSRTYKIRMIQSKWTSNATFDTIISKLH